MPYSYWAKIKRNVKGFVLSARGTSDSSDLQTIDLDLRADGPSTSLQVTGTVGKSNENLPRIWRGARDLSDFCFVSSGPYLASHLHLLGG